MAGRWLSDMMDKLTTSQKVARERKTTPKAVAPPTDYQVRRKSEGDAWAALEDEDQLRK